MRTENDFGREYAEQMISEGESEIVDINKMATSSVDIPTGDYDAMVDAGIENPNPRKYWSGYNERMAEEVRA